MDAERLESNFEVPSLHPFRIRHIFFANLHVARPEKLPEKQADLSLSTEIAVGLPGDGSDYNLFLRIRSTDESSIEFEAETIGVFGFLEAGEPDPAQLTSFINEHLLIAMASRVIQLVATLTGQMGMPPIWLPSPTGYGLEVATVEQLIKTSPEKVEFEHKE